jgi:hypothetical protein
MATHDADDQREPRWPPLFSSLFIEIYSAAHADLMRDSIMRSTGNYSEKEKKKREKERGRIYNNNNII